MESKFDIVKYREMVAQERIRKMYAQLKEADAQLPPVAKKPNIVSLFPIDATPKNNTVDLAVKRIPAPKAGKNGK